MKMSLMSAILIITLVNGLLSSSETCVISTEGNIKVAGSTSEVCVNLDLLLIIDQSKSMIGDSQAKIPANDADGYRIAAARYALQHLGKDQMFRCRDASYQLGVISFGSYRDSRQSAQIDRPLTRIEFVKDVSFDAWLEKSNEIGESIKSRDMNATDFGAAFDLASRVFQNAAPVPQNHLPHRKAIILITDGGPCVEGAGCEERNNLFLEKSFLDNYLNNLKTQIDTIFPFQPDYGYYFWTVVLHDQRGYDYLNLQQQWSEGLFERGKMLDAFWTAVTKDRGGALIKLSSNRHILLQKFVEILDYLLDSGSIVTFGCQPQAIEPYTEIVVFTLLKSVFSDNIELSFIDRENHRIIINAVNHQNYPNVYHSSHGPVEQFIISHPQPGFWNIQAGECSGMAVHRQLIRPYLKRILPNDQTLMQISTELSYTPKPQEIQLAYQLLERHTDAIFMYDSRYPIIIDAQITLPDGSDHDLLLKWDGEKYYLFGTTFISQFGVFRVDVNGYVYDTRNKHRYGAFDCESDSFVVEKMSAVRMPGIIPNNSTLQNPSAASYTSLPINVHDILGILIALVCIMAFFIFVAKILEMQLGCLKLCVFNEENPRAIIKLQLVHYFISVRRDGDDSLSSLGIDNVRLGIAVDGFCQPVVKIYASGMSGKCLSIRYDEAIELFMQECDNMLYIMFEPL